VTINERLGHSYVAQVGGKTMGWGRDRGGGHLVGVDSAGVVLVERSGRRNADIAPAVFITATIVTAGAATATVAPRTELG
jgi:hypothetical protein